MSYYAIVSFGGSFPGPAVYTDLDRVHSDLAQAELETAAGRGKMCCDPQVLRRARVYEYATREAASRADISDRGPDVLGGRPGTPGFVRSVSVRS